MFNPNGLGLGLFVSKLICERSKGDICCFSKGLGHGAAFEFRIQVEKASTSMLAVMNKMRNGLVEN